MRLHLTKQFSENLPFRHTTQTIETSLDFFLPSGNATKPQTLEELRGMIEHVIKDIPLE